MVTAVHMAMAESVAITNTDTRMTQGISKTGTMPTPTVIHAPTTDFLKESAVPSQQQVPAIVRNIHKRLMSQVTVDLWLQIDILRLAEEHPADVVLTLLHCAPTCDRFAVQAMKALLCQLQWDHVLVAMERKRGWDTMMRAITQEYGLGLLAREMWRVLIPLCSHTALHLLRHLSKENPCYDLIFLTVLVEILECLDLSKCRGSVLKTMSRLLELLGAPDVEVVSMSLHLFMNVLQHQDILVSSTAAPKLTEALLLLFDHVMILVVDEGKKPLKTIVNKSLFTLLIYCHDENWQVAKASQETLLGAAEFLKRRDLKQLLKKEQLSKFAECLLAEDSSSAAEPLRRALPYLQSPQEPLREAAVRFMGMAGRYLKGQPAELHLLTQALEAMSEDDSPSSTNLETQAIFGQRCAELRSSAGFREPGSQGEYQETVKRAPGLNVTGAPGTVDAGHSCACCKLP
nr:uncharacterized protein LOC121471222 [Taeniopygia guttata]